MSEVKRSWKRRLRDRITAMLFERSHRMTLRQAFTWKAWQVLSGSSPGAKWPIHPSSFVVHADRIKLGKGSRPGYSCGVYIQAVNGIEVGDYVGVAPGSSIISANHDPLNHMKHIPAPPIKLGNHVWICTRAVILPGVELGDNVVVAAGAVVNKSFPANVIVAGVPAKIVKTLGEPTPDEGTTE
mgnify:CR=1 FL=1